MPGKTPTRESDPLFVLARRVEKEPALQALWENGRKVRVKTSSGFRKPRIILFAANTVGVTDYGSIVVPVDKTLNGTDWPWRHVKTKAELDTLIDVELFQEELTALVGNVV